MILTKEYGCTNDKQVEVLSRGYKLHYRACVGSMIYLLYKSVDLCFVVHKMEVFSSNIGKVHFEGLVQSLIYIRDNKNLGLRYYANI